MAQIGKVIDFILKWEGGYTDHPNDPGGATNMGVTIGTLKGLGFFNLNRLHLHRIVIQTH